MITTVDSNFVKEQIPSTRVHSHGGAATSYVISTNSGFLDYVAVTNNTGTAGWVQIHDATSLPNNGAVPIFSFPLPADATVGNDTPIWCGTGCVVAISSTRATLTLSANAALFLANFKR